MIEELTGRDRESVRALFAPLDRHLIITAVIEGTSPGRIYADDPARPQIAFLTSAEGYFLAGRAGDETVNRALRRLVEGKVFPQLAAGAYGFDLHYTPVDWQSQFPAIFQTRYPLIFPASYFRFDTVRRSESAPLPDGYALQPVDAGLLARTGLRNLDVIQRKIASNWPTTAAFLDRGFGLCLLHGDTIVSECLADCVSGSRCEVGISTDPAYRRRGLAAATVAATVEHCRQRGFDEIGWHTADSNLGSVRTALAAGFQRVTGYPIFWACAGEFRNLLAQGMYHLEALHNPGRAARFFTLAFGRGRAEPRHYYAAACAWAGTGAIGKALECLHRALELGFRDWTRLETDPRLAPLRGTEGWPAIAARFRQ